MTATTPRGYVYYVGADPADLAAATAALAASVDTDVTNAVTPVMISTHGDIGAPFIASGNVYGAVNEIFTVRFRVHTEITPNRMIWFSTNQSGNYDIAIVDWATRTRLWSKGTTAWPAVGQVTETIVGGPTLDPGTDYGMSFAVDNITADLIGTFMTYSGQATGADGVVGVVNGTAFPIPATLPAYTSNDVVPLIILAEV